MCVLVEITRQAVLWISKNHKNSKCRSKRWFPRLVPRSPPALLCTVIQPPSIHRYHCYITMQRTYSTVTILARPLLMSSLRPLRPLRPLPSNLAAQWTTHADTTLLPHKQSRLNLHSSTIFEIHLTTPTPCPPAHTILYSTTRSTCLVLGQPLTLHRSIPPLNYHSHLCLRTSPVFQNSVTELPSDGSDPLLHPHSSSSV